MSFDLTVLATARGASDRDVRAQALSCEQPYHAEGDLNPRIEAFYDDVRAVFPDSGQASHSGDTPWASVPLGLGIDHVSMCLRHGCARRVVDLIVKLAAVHDPQGDEITHPTE
jgi:hypothetical protein